MVPRGPDGGATTASDLELCTDEAPKFRGVLGPVGARSVAVGPRGGDLGDARAGERSRGVALAESASLSRIAKFR